MQCQARARLTAIKQVTSKQQYEITDKIARDRVIFTNIVWSTLSQCLGGHTGHWSQSHTNTKAVPEIPTQQTKKAASLS